MILQRLAEHYDRLARSGEVHLPRLGSSQQRISFCLVLNPDGTLNSLEDMRRQEGKSLQPRTLIVPGQGKPSGSGMNPCFLWNNAEYLLGWSADPLRVDRAKRAFDASRKMHLALEDKLAHPAYAAVCSFLRGWTPAHAAEHMSTLTDIATNFGVFRIAGEQRFVHELVAMPVAVDAVDDTRVSSMCLVTGEHGPVARLHEPAIKGVAGAQPMGAKLVSFDKEAFKSYGKDQGSNASVSIVTVFKYANALNHLLDRKDRRIALGDATIVFWADHAAPLEDVFAEIFNGSFAASDHPATDASGTAASEPVPQEDQTRVREARLLLSQLRDGTRNALRTKDTVPTRFFILGLSPNASRLSVRLWIEADARELEGKLTTHLQDLALKGAPFDRPLSVRALVAATGRYDPKGKSKFDTTHVSQLLAGELARAVLTGSPYPQSFLATMVRRIRNDAYVGFERVSAIKACLVRNSRFRGAPLEIGMELDKLNMDVAYRCGRLFALLEKAQEESAESELNTTIKDRYFSSASATPAIVFPRLFRLNNHHLAKLQPDKRGFYMSQLGAAMTVPFEFPPQLSITQQGQFIVGYFQQMQLPPYPRRKKAPEEKA